MNKSPLSIRIIYILTSIVYYLTIITSSFGVIFAIGLLFGFWGNDVQLHIEMPVKANFEEIGQLTFFGKEVNVELVEASGKFHFIDTPTFVSRTVAIPMLIIFPMMFGLVFLFHRFIRNVSEGKIFEIQNFKLLRKLGVGLFVLWIFTVVYMNIMRYAILGDIKFDSLHISSDISSWYGGILLGALFTLVLSHIFLKGMELKEENELTI